MSRVSGRTSDLAADRTVTGRVIHKGRAVGRALVSTEPISFLGGVDVETGIVVEVGHPLQGVSIAGMVLVFPGGKGSTVGSYSILRLKRNGCGPCAMITSDCEAIVAVGAILADIPTIDRVDISAFRTSDWVAVEDSRVEVRRGQSA